MNGALYYAFYIDADPAFDGTLELKGLDPAKSYTAIEYAADEPREFEVKGSEPKINAQFERSYLLKVVEK